MYYRQRAAAGLAGIKISEKTPDTAGNNNTVPAIDNIINTCFFSSELNRYDQMTTMGRKARVKNIGGQWLNARCLELPF